MFTFAPVCAHLSKWCPNNSFYRILTYLTGSTLYRSYLLEPTSPPARPTPCTRVSRRVLWATSTQETEHESFHVSTCSTILDLTVLLENIYAELISFCLAVYFSPTGLFNACLDALQDVLGTLGREYQHFFDLFHYVQTVSPPWVRVINSPSDAYRRNKIDLSWLFCSNQRTNQTELF